MGTQKWLCIMSMLMISSTKLTKPSEKIMGDSDLNPRPWTSDRSQSQWGNVCLDFDPWLHFSSGLSRANIVGIIYGIYWAKTNISWYIYIEYLDKILWKKLSNRILGWLISTPYRKQVSLADRRERTYIYIHKYYSCYNIPY